MKRKTSLSLGSVATAERPDGWGPGHMMHGGAAGRGPMQAMVNNPVCNSCDSGAEGTQPMAVRPFAMLDGNNDRADSKGTQA
ncbi:hypothetical protein [Yoonia sp.]|uniref:hypothetical protein n=1 Tax=Yoonia sp. TaxID=2212373 RepID=UPI0025CC12E8|nr:hypothetical protein [Yoonia sp.]